MVTRSPGRSCGKVSSPCTTEPDPCGSQTMRDPIRPNSTDDGHLCHAPTPRISRRPFNLCKAHREIDRSYSIKCQQFAAKFSISIACPAKRATCCERFYFYFRFFYSFLFRFSYVGDASRFSALCMR